MLLKKSAETWVLNLLDTVSVNGDVSVSHHAIQLVEVDSAVIILHGNRLLNVLVVSRHVCFVKLVASWSPLAEFI